MYIFPRIKNQKMQDIEIFLENKPGALAHMGEILGKNKISLEGGGVFQTATTSIAHFLVEDASIAKRKLTEAGIKVGQIRDVLIQKLRQDVPGQLGMCCRRMADANINIVAQYSDHSNQLILIVDDFERGQLISEQWTKEWFNK